MMPIVSQKININGICPLVAREMGEGKSIGLPYSGKGWFGISGRFPLFWLIHKCIGSNTRPSSVKLNQYS